MTDTWFREYAEELARCLEDARACAEACERLLESLDAGEEPEARSTVIRAVLGPAAVSRVLIELIDQPRELVLGAARLCHDTAGEAVALLARLEDARTHEAAAALRTCAASCAALLEAL